MASPKSVFRFIGRSGRRVGITVAGTTVLGAGLFMLVLPGPGILVVLAGLAILGTEYAWARRALNVARERGRRVAQRVRNRRARSRPQDPTSG